MNKQILDPVCGMMVDPDSAAAKAEYQGKTYYFCSRGCKVAFERDPAKYLQGQQSQTQGHHQHH